MKTPFAVPLFLFSLCFSVTLHAATLAGAITDASGERIAGATVSVTNVRSVNADANGSFAIDLPEGTYELRVSHPGFQAKSLRVATGARVEVTLDPAFSETMVVSAIRADASTPVTKTDIPREEIEEQYYGQDLPLLLRDAPGVNAFSESGAGGTGYSYITLRGVSPSRINFTLDGVPLADSEDMGTYFADFPDLARSLESVQIQRGVGTSTVGTPSFGGSVNMQSVDIAQEENVDATFGVGSYGNRQASVGYQSGALPGGFGFYTRLSWLENDGFRDNSGVKQTNLFFSGSKPVGEGLLKLTGFSGDMNMQASYYAVDEPTLQNDLRFNPLGPEERDQFGYDLAQLQYLRPIDASSDMTASIYYQRGYGWFRLMSGAGELREYGLDGLLIGSILTLSKAEGPWTLNTGVHVNRFKRDHTRTNLVHDRRDYANYGVKGEANAFAKLTWTAGPWLFYGDAQVRHANFEYHGDASIPSIDWTFFNPKAGVRRTLSANSSWYASVGMTTREPARLDMFLGEDNPPEGVDPHGVKPERVLDFEAGWSWRGSRADFAANVYAMEFRNEIAATGEQSEIGLSLRKNVDRSHRRGIELDAAWQLFPTLRLETTANVSHNRIREWTQFIDVYDAAGEWSGSRPQTYRNVEPVLTPALMISQSVDYTPTPRFGARATGRWVGRSWLDNTNNPQTDAPAYFVLDGSASYGLTDRIRLTLQVNNILDDETIRPSGYSYLYYTEEELSGTAYYYPHATRNAVLLLDFDL